MVLEKFSLQIYCLLSRLKENSLNSIQGMDGKQIRLISLLFLFQAGIKMLIKEYRIPMPLTVEEYRIAQLYMIAVS